MQILNSTIHKNTFQYELIQRNQNFAIYAQYIEDEIIAYEVFRIKIQKAQVVKLGGRTIFYAEKEMFPSNEDFGYIAFTCGNLAKAEKRFEEMTAAYLVKQISEN